MTCIIRCWTIFLLLRGKPARRNGLSSYWPRRKYKNRSEPFFTITEPGTSSQRRVLPAEHCLDLLSPLSVKQKIIIFKNLLIVTLFSLPPSLQLRPGLYSPSLFQRLDCLENFKSSDSAIEVMNFGLRNIIINVGGKAFFFFLQNYSP